MSRRHIVIPGKGDPCPRCGQATEIREHKCIGARELRRPWYYARWFYCVNPRCRTTVIVVDRYKVFNVKPPVQHRLAQIAEQLDLPTCGWFTTNSSSSAEVPW
jgi:hypothetical protein